MGAGTVVGRALLMLSWQDAEARVTELSEDSEDSAFVPQCRGRACRAVEHPRLFSGEAWIPIRVLSASSHGSSCSLFLFSYN